MGKKEWAIAKAKVRKKSRNCQQGLIQLRDSTNVMMMPGERIETKAKL